METFSAKFILSALLGVAILDSQIQYATAQATSTVAVTQFTDLTVNGTKVWVILAAVGGVVGAIIILLLILVCCAFARRGSKVGPPGVESGGHYIVDPDRFPSVETQTDYHPGFAPLMPKVDRATMTKRSIWTGVTSGNENATPACPEEKEPANGADGGRVMYSHVHGYGAPATYAEGSVQGAGIDQVSLAETAGKAELKE